MRNFEQWIVILVVLKKVWLFNRSIYIPYWQSNKFVQIFPKSLWPSPNSLAALQSWCASYYSLKLLLIAVLEK